MNVKKVLAGVLATAVAVSATAATALSASAADTEKTFGTKVGAKYFAEIKDEASVYDIALTRADAETDGVLKLKFDVEGNAGKEFKISDVKLQLKGKKSGTGTKSKTYKLDAVKDTDDQFTIKVGTNAAAQIKSSLFVGTTKDDEGAIDEAVLTYTVKAYGTKAQAKDYAKGVTVSIDASFVDAADVAATDVLGDALKDAFDDYENDLKDGKASSDVGGLKIASKQTINIGNDDDSESLEGIVGYIASYLGDKKGATLTFNFKAPDKEDALDGGDSYDTFDFGAAAKNFGVAFNNTAALSSAANVDKDNYTATFNVDDLLKAANVTNVTGWLNSIKVKNNGSDALELLSIKVLIPEAATTTAAPAVVTDPATTTAGTPAATDPGSNPKTGAVALALVPVALAAAGLAISKKK